MLSSNVAFAASYEAKVSLLGQDIVNNPYWIYLHKSTFKFVKTR